MQKPYVCNETRPRFTYVHNRSLTTVYRSKMVYRSEHALWTVSSDAMMLVRVEAGDTVLPERLATMLVGVEAGHTVLPERLAMMLVAVEVGHVVGHVLSISLVQ